MVAEEMDTDPPYVPSSMKVNELIDRITQNDPVLKRRHEVLIVDNEGSLTGIVTMNNLIRFLEGMIADETTVLNASV